MNDLTFVRRSLIILVLILVTAFSSPLIAQDDITPLFTELERILSGVYKNTSPSVVSIIVDERIGTEFVPLSSGSGFVIDNDGHIVTNYHVVEGADRIVVNFLDGTIVRAEVVGLDADSDIAVIKVNLPGERLIPVNFADSDELTIGQMAVAIGSPFGQRWTMTYGIISALNRQIEGLAEFRTGGVIQTDTPINPGNSGGPLLNLAGEVIGVNSQIFSEVRANSGVGFAVPSNLVNRVTRELIDRGRVNYSYLGISGDDINLDYIEQLGLENNTRGVVVTLVRSGEPAALGGLLDPNFTMLNGARRYQAADIITAINGEPITGFASLLGYLSINTIPGDVVNMTILRNGQFITLPVELGSRN